MDLRAISGVAWAGTGDGLDAGGKVAGEDKGESQGPRVGEGDGLGRKPMHKSISSDQHGVT